MSADVHEYDASSVLFENCTVVAGHVDASAAGKRLVDRMVAEERMERIRDEQAKPLVRMTFDCSWKFEVFLSITV